MSSPAFSVIIPAYKMGRYIGEAIDSVGSQSFLDWEVIIVDDCAPEDGTSEIVRAFAARHPDHRVEFIRHEVNTGVSGARNTAINASCGEYLALLDPDDIWMPNYLQKVHARFSGLPECALVTSPPIAFWQESGGPTTKYTVRRFKHWEISQFPFSLAVGNFIQPCATVIRRSWIAQVGGFDTDPALQHIEDYDFWIRLAEAGAEFSFINENLTKYRKHPTGATADHKLMQGLHARLTAKHPGFFLSGQSHMLGMLMSGVTSFRTPLIDRIRNRLANLLGR